ncbi:MAG TPA: CBS domain-containing protein [Pyrinomonadaceae bacterium]
MQVREIMTKNPACCTPDTNLREVAQMMVEYDCGCIPIVENQSSKKPIGTVTDRDITIRAFTTGRNPIEMKASDVMTMGITTISPDTSIQDCADVMEDKKIRRVIVTDENGKCVGIVAQADIAEYGPNPYLISDVVHEISEAEPSPTRRTANNQFYSNNRSYRNNQDSGNQSYSNRQFNSDNRSFRNKKRYSSGESYSVKESSLFGLSTILPLLAGIGISFGAKYFLDSNKETRPRPVAQTETSGTATSVHTLTDTKNRDLTTRTGSGSTVTDSTFDRDLDFPDRDNDLNPILEVGRTAGQS